MNVIIKGEREGEKEKKRDGGRETREMNRSKTFGSWEMRKMGSRRALAFVSFDKSSRISLISLSDLKVAFTPLKTNKAQIM